ncbi:structural protein P5 [Pseudomonas sp. 5P_3.1_Bac2]|uniref:structural protein P5 n=1 Tax=Pseudomonas sp. 5P_3.1_Bac2 TaxID=2971617 RepID=UPI0021C7762F|nr:structural protein P5 [Pseudomonas sp. 5P_3.1_Bac2]MCU1717325.1 structural protein P5 [Pseudomonas sp. 5P_3.1_Bac2]
MPSTTRGVRNNNPGNIDYNPRNAWQGQLGLEVGVPSPRFARFDTPENGIRALGKLLINYSGKDGMPGVGGPGIDTVRETITRWAPGNENNTEAYIAAVARRLGVKANDVIDIRNPATLELMVSSIIAHENAGFAYPQAVLAEGLRRALS